MADISAQGPAKTYTFWSVVALLFFWPTGAAAVFQSGKTYAANQAQQWDAAHLASRKVRLYQNISGAVFLVLFLLGMFAQCSYNP